MAQKDVLNAKEYVKELRNTYWEGYSAGYDAAIENLRHSVGSACVSARVMKKMTMKKEQEEIE